MLPRTVEEKSDNHLAEQNCKQKSVFTSTREAEFCYLAMLPPSVEGTSGNHLVEQNSQQKSADKAEFWCTNPRGKQNSGYKAEFWCSRLRSIQNSEFCRERILQLLKILSATHESLNHMLWRHGLSKIILRQTLELQTISLPKDYVHSATNRIFFCMNGSKCMSYKKIYNIFHKQGTQNRLGVELLSS